MMLPLSRGGGRKCLLVGDSHGSIYGGNAIVSGCALKYSSDNTDEKLGINKTILKDVNHQSWLVGHGFSSYRSLYFHVV